MQPQTFYFRKANHFDTVEVSNDNNSKKINFKDGLTGEETLVVDFGTLGNASTKSNVSALRKLGLTLLKITNGVKDESFTSKVASKIKIRMATYRYLYDFLSAVELCYVEFSDGSCAVIGEYIESLTGEDCLILDNRFDFEDIVYSYNLDGYGIHSAISKYFQVNGNKKVVESYIVSDKKLFELVKERI